MSSQAMNTPEETRWVNPTTLAMDAEFRDLLPVPSAEVRATLERTLWEDGAAETFVVWAWKGRLILLIGYPAYPRFREQGWPCRILEKSFAHRGEACRFIVDYCLAKQLTTRLAMSYYRGLRCRQDQLPPGGDRKSAPFRRSVGKRLSAEDLGALYGVHRNSILKEAAFAAALDALAQLGGSRIRPLILGQSTYGTMGKVIALAKRSEDEQRRKLKELIFTGKLPPCDPKGDRPKTIVLPREPISRLMQKLLEQLSLEEAVEGYQEYEQILQRRLVEKGQGAAQDAPRIVAVES